MIQVTNYRKVETEEGNRKKFEKTRWLTALRQTKLPVHICWAAAARVAMAYYLKEQVCQEAKLTIMKGLGHFCQLGSPQEWLRYVSSFHKKGKSMIMLVQPP